MEMGSLTQRQYSDNLFQQTKGFKENPREILYLRWVNYKIKKFLKIMDDSFPNKYEDLFWSTKKDELLSIFNNFLKVKTASNFQNFSKVNIRLSSVINIIQLKTEIYYLMAFNLDHDFVFSDDDFHDFFESFIVFTHRIFLKNEDYYENDIFDNNRYINNDEFDIDGINEIIDSDSDSDSDSD